MGRVVVLGSLSQDLHVHVERHPRTGETVMGGDLERRFGGKGANQAVAAARAGATTVMVGRLGDDEAGHAYRERLGAFGIDVAGLRIDEGAPTGTAIIYNDAEGDNMIVVAPGANHRVGLDDVSLLDDLTAEDVLLMPLELQHAVVVAAVEAASARGTRVVLNLAPFAPLPPEVLAACDPVVVNEHEAAQLADAGLTPPSLLVTLGPEGSRWGEEGVAASHVPSPVDTTGAGDAYCGTLAAHLARGAEPGAAMEAASAAAAECVRHDGAQPEVASGG